ncbi:MAG TPA: hypothetical protein VGB44_08595 [Flavobacterium sp.]|jgi:hypothetical protein
MEALIKLVTEKTGISHDQATTAVHTVLNFVKEKLPPGVGQHLDGYVNGSQNTNDGSGGIMDNLKDKMGGMFGK